MSILKAIHNNSIAFNIIYDLYEISLLFANQLFKILLILILSGVNLSINNFTMSLNYCLSISSVIASISDGLCAFKIFFSNSKILVLLIIYLHNCFKTELSFANLITYNHTDFFFYIRLYSGY